MPHLNILLTFKGHLSFNVINTLLASLESKLHRLEEDLSTRKRLYNILVECLQNIAHHSGNDATVLVTAGTGMYNVHAGNIIVNRNVEHLKEIIQKVNNLAPEELRETYKQTLSNREYTKKGTAGLGLIDIARKSGQKLNYEFKRVNHQYTIFNLSINLPRETVSHPFQSERTQKAETH